MNERSGTALADRARQQPKVQKEDPMSRLTPREREVLHWIVEGKTNGDIGRILEISSRTVEKHCESIFRKLGIENRYSAIVLALTGNRPAHSPS